MIRTTRLGLSSERLKAAAPYVVLIALNLLYRIPALLNAAAVHSDAAIVGLQAMHLLKGETSRFLWGADYQGSFDAYVAAAFFAVGGANPLTLMFAPIFGHLVLSCAVLATLVRQLGSRATALVACLPLVFTPQAVNGVVVYAPRQWSITLTLVGAVVMAWPAKRFVPERLALGLGLSILALYLDMFCVLWLPAVGLLALLICLDPPLRLKTIAVRLAGAGVGAVLGTWAERALRESGVAKNYGVTVDLSVIERTWPLLRDTCLPWLLGAKVWIPGKNLYPDLWVPPAPVRAFQLFGAVSILLLALVSVVLAFNRRVPWSVKRLVLFGAAATGTALVAFLVSGWPVDMWSTRYLAPVVWSLPFTLAALAYRLRRRGLIVLLAPYLVVAVIGGWLSWGPYVDGPLPRLDARGAATEEAELGAFLRQRGFEHGYAQRWLAHRLTFLWHEHPAIASFEPNRYPPYAVAAEQAKKKAYLFHPSEPRAQPGPYLRALRQRPGKIEVQGVAGFTVILYEEP
jgi:hypothetical protein